MKGIPVGRAARQRVSRCGRTLPSVPPRRLFFFPRCGRPSPPRMNLMAESTNVVERDGDDSRRSPPRTKPVDPSAPTVAQQIARAAPAFEERLTGRSPRTVAVVLSGETLVITLHGALSPAEQALAKTVDG